MLPIEQSCYWMATSPTASMPSLHGTVKTNIAIIGAGFTGLWASLFLKELDPSIEISIVEQKVAGYGGSGRNGGILSETIDHNHQLAIQHFGLDEAKKLAEIGRKNVNEMESFFAKENIDCDYEQTGRLSVALTQNQVEDCKRAIHAAYEIGITNLKFLDAEQTRAEIRSPLYLGAVLSPGGGILNPMKLIHALKEIATRKDIHIYEQSPVHKIDSGSVETQNGTVVAEKIILATDSYSHFLAPNLIHRFIPLYDYILVSDRLTESQLNLIGWKKRQGVTDGRTFFNYYRLTKDNRILWGTSEAQYYSPNRVDASCDHSESHYSALKESFVKHFPQLRELRFEYS